MPRPKKDNDHKKIPVKFWVLPSYVPIIKNVIKNLDDNDAISYIQPQTKKEPEVVSKPQIEQSIKKSSFGIDANEWIKNHADKVVDIENKESQQKDYTAWQADPLMQDIYNSCLWDAGGDNQCYPDGVEEYQKKYKDLWGRLIQAKSNNKTQTCNEIMTEMMERIYNE